MTPQQQNMTASGESQSSSSLGAFDELPPELRNMIWELAFTPGRCATRLPNECDDSKHRTVSLMKVLRPPSMALLLTSRQIAHEAGLIYRDAQNIYWTTTIFSLRFPDHECSLEQRKYFTSRVMRLDSNIIQRITRLVLHVDDGESGFPGEIHFTRNILPNWVGVCIKYVPEDRPIPALMESRMVHRVLKKHGEKFQGQRIFYQNFDKQDLLDIHKRCEAIQLF